MAAGTSVRGKVRDGFQPFWFVLQVFDGIYLLYNAVLVLLYSNVNQQ